MIVDVDRGGGIEPVEDEVDVLAGEHDAVGGDAGAVLPAVLADPLQLGLVVVIEGIGDQLIGDEVEVNVARHGRGAPDRVDGGVRLSVRVAELPA